MRNSIVIYILFCFILAGCSKDKNAKAKRIYVSYDIPFEMSPLDTAVLKDPFYTGGELKVFIKNLNDARSYKSSCSSSTGGSLNFDVFYKKGNDIDSLGRLYIGGCVNENSEFPLIVERAKVANIQTILHLYKVMPLSSENVKKTSDYSIKFVLLRK